MKRIITLIIIINKYINCIFSEEEGLKLSNPTLKSYNYSFIRELKKSTLINDYTYFIEYNKDNPDEGNIIFGVEPHEYDKDKYIEEQMVSISTSQIAYDLYWQLQFNEIYFARNFFRFF